jgi:hypothetical protein
VGGGVGGFGDGGAGEGGNWGATLPSHFTLSGQSQYLTAWLNLRPWGHMRQEGTPEEHS